MPRAKRVLVVVGVCSAIAGWGFVACSATPPPQPGDDVMNDTTTDAATYYDVFIPPGPVSDATFDTMMYADATLYYPPPDGYAPLAVCDQCACGAKKDAGADAAESGSDAAMANVPPDFCFGGGTNMFFNGTCGVGDGTTLVVGCNPLPAACYSNPTCACILEALPPPTLPCYPVCVGTNPKFEVYCPNP